jgi:phospholipid/cholesterol/gamma-HCH transport system ATP-binding protein
MTPPAARRAVLAFDRARLELRPGWPPLRPASLVLDPGDFALVDAGDAGVGRAVADAATGLLAPVEGRVLFMGDDWARASPDDANAMRGRIGRLAAKGLWVPGLSVEDNVLIQQLHHTRRDAALLARDAARLARHFGLPGLPRGLPEDLLDADLRRVALVRLFLGRPRLVVLEHHPHLGDREHLAPIVDAARMVRERGGAVLWITLDPRIWGEASLPATRRMRIIGGEISEGTGPR